MHGTKKISDYLNDIKINSFKKKKQLVLEKDGNIVWVIGKRLDDRFKITSDTKKVLKLCLK
jgi:tRNA(Ile)-lysidine synthase